MWTMYAFSMNKINSSIYFYIKNHFLIPFSGFYNSLDRVSITRQGTGYVARFLRLSE
jgi:hypothetical protein